MRWKRIGAASPRGNRPPRRAVAFAAAAAALAAGLTVASVGGASAAPHAAAIASVAAQAPPSCTAGTAVQTKDGPVCGLTANSITSYLDIPYA
jgi:para-nitrobenzyl esterase